MKSNPIRFLPLILTSLVFIACAPKKTKPAESREIAPATSATKASEPQTGIEELSFKPIKLDLGPFSDIKVTLRAFHAEAHQRYLADPMKFQALPDQGLAQGRTAVVGSRVCVLYPNAKLATAADLAKLPTGIPIPFSTIIPVNGEKVINADDQGHYGMFQFQDNWNFFYHTTYQGKDGLVFGADLYGLDDSNAENRISARLYQTKGKYDAFYPVAGYMQIPSQISDRLERDRLAFQAVAANEYSLSGSLTRPMPDDMLALYAKHRPSYFGSVAGWSRDTPLFITTDVVAHAQHLMFDRTLQYLEEAVFLPRLKDLDGAFIDALEKRKTGASGYEETLEKARLYFQVAQALLELAPDRVSSKDDEGSRPEIRYVDKDKDAVLSAYPQQVRDEIAKMDGAAGFDQSSVFVFKDGSVSKEDYSQYKPRGHYTKNGALSAYFRAMMWYGRINFLIARPGKDPLPMDGSKSSDSTQLTLEMEPIALLITDLVKKDSTLYKDWCDLFDPITALIGISDDLSFKELLPLWKDEGVSEREFAAWAGDKRKVLAFMEKAHEKLRPPAISGFSVIFGPSEGKDRKPPMGWRLFGQRFTYDSYVHQLVSAPRLRTRDMVSGLDIMKALGSSTADSYLASAGEYAVHDGLKETLDSLESEFNSRDAEFWQRSYYNEVLFQIRQQALFEPGTGFYFTESPAWGKKAMLSSHGSWAELRHDTLLYVKQVYAEFAGDGDFYPTFRTEKIPDPIHYLEPNLPFWQGSAIAIQDFLKTLDQYGLLDEESMKAFGRLREICAKAAEIANTETQDKPVAAKDVEWIATIPSELIGLILVHVNGGLVEDPEQLKMGIVADVFTNALTKEVLETGVGIPYRIYVPLNDGQGGKRIAIGYCFSYYEFPVAISDRMTDETWRKIAYDPKTDLAKYLPSWENGIALPPISAVRKE